MGFFSRDKDKGDDGPGYARLTDPAMLRRKGKLEKARILGIESKPSVGGSVSDPAYQCTLRLEVLPAGEPPFEVSVQQRMTRSILGQLQGDGVIAPAWVDPKDRSKVAVDVAAGEIERAPEV